ncbi:MAG: HD domain-containing protein [Geodermatophilaceae bacterium]|nr:HD domain-containing protein [Geodermatophilaceae bacterium]
MRTRAVRETAERSLAPAATRSSDSAGRARPEEPDEFRTAFERDRDRILFTKAFRRLKHKTQVFLNPEGDHFVTRLTHTLQVTQVARSLAAALGLNEDLAEAIALGHDVGHSPFGHIGEDALSPYVDGGWHHAAQSVRIFEVLEDKNLSAEVLDGIRAHSWKISPPPATPEGACVRYADRIAYLSHDALDAVRARLLVEDDFPDDVRARFGHPGSEMVGSMIEAVVTNSVLGDTVAMSDADLAVMSDFRNFMFERVYFSDHHLEHKAKAITIIRDLVDLHNAKPDMMPATYRDHGTDRLSQAVDYVAGMTDRFAESTHARLCRRRTTREGFS